MGLGRKLKIVCGVSQTLLGLIFIGLGVGIGFLFLNILEGALQNAQKIHCSTDAGHVSTHMDSGAEACNGAYQDNKAFHQWATTNRSDAPAIWQRFYVHDLDNLDQVITGSDPHFTHKGPYVYREHNDKYDVEFSTDYSEVRFHTHVRFEFDAEKTAAECSSCGDPDTDTSTNLYIPYYTALTTAALGDESNLLFSAAAVGVATSALPLLEVGITQAIAGTQYGISAGALAGLEASFTGDDVDPVAQWGSLSYTTKLQTLTNGYSALPVPSDASEADGFKPTFVLAAQMAATDTELELPRWAVSANASATAQFLCNGLGTTGSALGTVAATGVARSSCFWTDPSDARTAWALLTGTVPTAGFESCAGANTANVALIGGGLQAGTAPCAGNATCEGIAVANLAAAFGVPPFDGPGHSAATTLLVLWEYAQFWMANDAVQSGVQAAFVNYWTSAGVPAALQANVHNYPKIWQTKTITNWIFFDYANNRDGFTSDATCVDQYVGFVDNFQSIDDEITAAKYLNVARDMDAKLIYTTGQDDWKKSGFVVGHDSHTGSLPSWTTDASNGYFGTEDYPPQKLIAEQGQTWGRNGFKFPPGKADTATSWKNVVDETMKAILYEPALFRATPIEFVRHSEVKGIKTLQFTAVVALAVAEDPDVTCTACDTHAANYPGYKSSEFGQIWNQEHVMKHIAGAQMPTYFTAPHFFGSESYPHFDITDPDLADTEKMSLFDVDPISGQTLAGQKRGQANFYAINVEADGTFDLTAAAADDNDAPTKHHLVPLFWSERRASMRQKDADTYKKTVIFALDFQKILFLGCVIFGAVWAPLCLFFTVKQCKAKKRETVPQA